jgi:hypothetical protein
MKKILEQWKGQFLINHEIKKDLKDFNPKDGEQIKIRLLARRKER